jgi:hypothetical protein
MKQAIWLEPDLVRSTRGSGQGLGWSYEIGRGMIRGTPGRGCGTDPGMVWGGWDSDRYDRLTPEKRRMLCEVAVSTQRTMLAQIMEMDKLLLARHKATTQFPIDKNVARQAWDNVEELRKQMFETRMDAIAKAQAILGEDLW